MSQPVTPHQSVAFTAANNRADSESEITFLRLIGVAFRYGRLIVGMGLLFGLVAGLKGLMAGYSYAADASFIAQGAHAPTQVSAVAAQFGISTGAAEGAASPQFYVDLMKSREILRGVARSDFVVKSDTGLLRGNLIKVLGLRGRSPIAREVNAMRTLAGLVTASPSAKTGVITLKAVSEHPDLSAQIVNRFIEQINKFNLESRKTRSSEERKFVDARLVEASQALSVAESQLEEFLLSNRTVGSPSLTLQQERLKRNVDARQQLFTALAQAEQQARIEEVRDTPGITVIDSAVPPLQPLPRGTVNRTVKSVIFGSLVGLLLAFLLDFIQHSRSDAEIIQALKRLSRRGFKSPFPARALER